MSSSGIAPEITPAVQVARDANGALEIVTDTYRLRFQADRPFARLEGALGAHWASLFLACSAHTRETLDDTHGLEGPTLEEIAGGVCVRVDQSSSTWTRKTLVFTCTPNDLRVHLELTGDGALTDLHLFGGYHSGHLRFGSGWITSGAGFQSVFNPEPYGQERRAIPASESTAIDAMGTSLPSRAHWFFTPAPLVYAVSRSRVTGSQGATETAMGADQGGAPATVSSKEFSNQTTSSDAELPAGPWLALGLLTEPGEHNYTGFHFDAAEGSFSLRLPYEGHTRVSGTWTSPAVWFGFDQPDPYAALESHTRTLETLGLVNLQPRVQPEWWSHPIQCGWGAQCVLAGQLGARAPDLAKQVHYDAFLAAVEARGLRAGTLVIDDKWASAYGTCEADLEKWPDLRGWIDARHAAGQRVLLWWKAWDTEGVPMDECVTNAAGAAITTDPTNPKYERRLRQAVRRMLGEYDADGVKVDFSARTPSGPALKRHGKLWGLELLHRLLWILFDEAKRVKPDALVMTHAANPYFSSVSDMIRLNDINTGQPVVPQMRHRAKVARAACPNLLIDTDNWPQPNLRSWRAYTAIQRELGVPSFYYATHVDSGEALEDADYALLRRVWGLE